MKNNVSEWFFSMKSGLLLFLKYFSFAIFASIVLSGCGGGGGGGGSNPNTNVTISGIATDDPISGATVQLEALGGTAISSTTTDQTGAFTLQTTTSSVDQGYALVVRGGQIGGQNFTGELRSQYAADDDRSTANVTLMTTLIARMAAQETSGTALEKRNAVIARLVSMGVVHQGEWNDTAPTGVSLTNLRHDIDIQGFNHVMDAVTTDLHDGNVNFDDMAYFPQAQGGIARLAFGDNQNRISVFPGASGTSPVSLLAADTSATYAYVLKDSPSWLSVNPQSGLISYAVPADTVPSRIPFSITATNNTTGLGRTVAGQIYVMSVQPIAQGTVGTQGGSVTNAAGDIVVDVPAGAVTAPTQVTVTRGRDAAGRVIINVNTGGDTPLPFTVHLPDPNVLNANTPPAAPAGQPQSRLVQPQAARAAQVVVAEAADGGSCIQAENNTPTMTHCWQSNRAYFGPLFHDLLHLVGFARLPDNSYTCTIGIFTSGILCRVLLRDETASELWSSVAIKLNPSGVSSKEPVLFIHGYNKNWDSNIDGLGGGKDTWGNFENLVANLHNAGTQYVPFEFRWNTNARFQNVADDLISELKLIKQQTGRKVHIIAHSFGGVLVRVMLQKLSDSHQSVADLVADVITVGTPHSGIKQSAPKGSDSALITFCRQISCYQTGLNISLAERSQTNFVLKTHPGYITDELQTTTGNLPSLPIDVLIGLTVQQTVAYNHSSISTTPQQAHITRTIDNGDAVISYVGQRFTRALSLVDATTGNVTYKPLLNAARYGNATVSEHLLGFTDTTHPGDDVSNQSVVLLYGDGYSHTGGRTTILPRGNSAGEVKINCPSDTGCKHDTWLQVKQFLHDHNAAASATLTFNVSGVVKDVNGNGIAGVKISFSTQHMSLTAEDSPVVTDQAGNFTVTLPFLPNTTYHLSAFPPNGYRAATSTGSLTTARTPGLSSGQFPATILTRDTVSAGSLGGVIKDAVTGQPLTGASYILKNSIGFVVGSGTATDGHYVLANLPAGMYQLAASANGYTNAQTTCTVQGLTSNSCSLTLTGNLAANGMMRIVLEWALNPVDLDSHLVKYDASGNQLYHIYYGAKNGGSSGDNLDVDDTTSYGPETVTIQSLDPLARYVYDVHHYYGTGSLTTTSQARVTVTYGGHSVTFNVPTSGAGTDWKVFEINNGVIQPCQANCMFSDNASAVRSAISTPLPGWLVDILGTMPAK